jgi:hypothetical protein
VLSHFSEINHFLLLQYSDQPFSYSTQLFCNLVSHLLQCSAILLYYSAIFTIVFGPCKGAWLGHGHGGAWDQVTCVGRGGGGDGCLGRLVGPVGLSDGPSVHHPR